MYTVIKNTWQITHKCPSDTCFCNFLICILCSSIISDFLFCTAKSLSLRVIESLSKSSIDLPSRLSKLEQCSHFLILSESIDFTRARRRSFSLFEFATWSNRCEYSRLIAATSERRRYALCLCSRSIFAICSDSSLWRSELVSFLSSLSAIKAFFFMPSYSAW